LPASKARDRATTADRSITVHIEQATREHLDAVAALFDAYRQFYRQPPDLAAARRFIAQRLERGDAHVMCAVDGGAVAGFAQLFPTLDSIGLARAWILHDLFVAPEHRRKGVARMLVRAAHDLGLRTESSLLTLATGVDNRNAQALYESEGWIRDDDYYYYELHLAPA